MIATERVAAKAARTRRKMPTPEVVEELTGRGLTQKETAERLKIYRSTVRKLAKSQPAGGDPEWAKEEEAPAA